MMALELVKVVLQRVVLAPQAGHLLGEASHFLDDGRFVSEDTKLCTESLHVARALSRASAPV
eukprot:CAMPEP_0181389878 /NCGR_PEP_ID=MMETSP1106-20121128/25161_1 /TAXON_ID=81844 /ORGANISM="Mantoniella antarctica, Strain SL-175" /LENGTH=61 /DNA_ID=CAMNT_0023510701 /DNA_START=26 /DNA_END=211 /DNA_ORIENTATION=-